MTEFGRGAFFEELAFAGLKVAKAWDMLHDPEVTKHMKSADYMNLCRDAGYAEEEVQRAGNQWANMRLDRDLEP